MRYTELASTLVKAITEGPIQLGAQLPSEVALAEQYQVSRTTVRSSLNILEGLGLITRRRRAGTVVCSKTTTNSYTKSLHSIEDLVNYASHTERQILSVSDVIADEHLANALACRPGQKWLKIQMLRTEKNESKTPVCCNDAYLEPEVGRAILPLVQNGSGLLCQIIEKEIGLTVADIKQTIGATTMGDAMSRLLLATEGTPGLEITRHYQNKAKKTFLVTVNVYPADKFKFTFWMHRAETVNI